MKTMDENVAKIKEHGNKNRYVTIHEGSWIMEKHLDESSKHITDCHKLPCLLAGKQKQQYVNVCQDLQENIIPFHGYQK
jgi:hypothetical protein